MRALEKSKKIGGQRGQNSASHKKFQRFTPLHSFLPT
jgi:hypothetical protein